MLVPRWPWLQIGSLALYRPPPHLERMSDPVTRLNTALEGRYTIERELGEGGMATVYLADDVKHERKVALKVLKPELAAVVGAERFLAEIKTTANLQHPHILPLFDSGDADGFLFYVMPYLEGESLRDRLDREKQLPVDEAVRIATAVANALDHAHRHKVIHRDIKPANILLQDGEPVVADFGIALAVGAGDSHRLTETGLSVGTPYYMSPEQATGDQHVGPPTDTYALGCVLYEMLVGEPPYPGSTAQAVLGRIIAGKPVSATEYRESVPAHVDAAVRCALEKLPADRFASSLAFAKALADPGFRYGEPIGTGAGPGAGPWKRLTYTFASLFVVAAGGLGWSLLRPEAPARVARFTSPFEEDRQPTGRMGFTPDGSAIVYAGPGESRPDTPQLWIRAWEDLAATPVRGSEGARGLALSPDGTEMAFFPIAAVDVDNLAMQVVSVTGGTSRTLPATGVAVWDWARDGKIYFTGSADSLGLRRVSATGGADAVDNVTELRDGEVVHLLLDVLPGGTIGVFEVVTNRGTPASGVDGQIWSIDLETGERWLLTDGNNPRYAASGHLLFGTLAGALMAAPFDPSRPEVIGAAVSVVQGLVVGPTGLVNYAVSDDGTLIYAAGGTVERTTEFVWVSRSGEATPVSSDWTLERPPITAGRGWRLSPDGARLAFAREIDGNTDIWVKQLPDGPLRRLTFDDGVERYPAWTPDGDFVSYSRGDTISGGDIWKARADGTGAPELVVRDERSLLQASWSPGSDWMVLRVGSTATEGVGRRDVLGFEPGTNAELVPLVANPESQEIQPALSPDGRWLAYASNESGRFEVYVSPFPDVESDRVTVSTDGGWYPMWAHGTSELFYRDLERGLVAVQFETAPGFVIVQSRTLFSIPRTLMLTPFNANFIAVSTDDQRFLMRRNRVSAFTASAGRSFVLIQNWFEELRRLVPN